MLSLRNLWSPGLPSSADYIRSLKSLLEGVSTQSEELSSPELSQLRTELAAIAVTLTESTTAEQLQQIVASALEILNKYTRTSGSRVSAHLAELKATMRALTDTVTFLSESRTTVVHQLTFIERQLEQASEFEDVRLLRPKLLSCLELIREETARLQNESAANSELVRSSLGAPSNASTAPRRVGSLDPVTGLPGRQVAECLLDDKIAAGKECIAALFLPSRLESVNRHHGRSAGDQVLLHVAQHLAAHIKSPASLCRWTGPAFVAFVEAPAKSLEISRTWATAASKCGEVTINLGRRSALIPVSVAILTRQVTAQTSAAALWAEFDRFLDANTEK